LLFFPRSGAFLSSLTPVFFLPNQSNLFQGFNMLS
jgi:hypothetical protein